MGINASINRRLMPPEDRAPTFRFFAALFIALAILLWLFGPARAQEYGHADDDRERVTAADVRAAGKSRAKGARAPRQSVVRVASARRQSVSAVIIPHPPGCPPRLFCACGASVKVFGQSIRALWPSTAWLRFPRTAPGHMKVAARRGHVFVIDYMIDARTAMAWDFNSGGRQSRYHARSIAGYVIVDPVTRTAAVR